MANIEALGSIAPFQSGLHVYDSIDDGDLFKVSDISQTQGAIEKSHSAAFNHLCLAKDDTGWPDDRGAKGIGHNEIKLEIPRSASRDLYESRPISFSSVSGTYEDVADQTSESYSNHSMFSRGHMPSSSKMPQDLDSTGDNLSRHMVSLRASYTRDAPYVSPYENEIEDEIKNNNKCTKIKKITLVTLVVTIIGIILVAAVVISVFLQLKVSEDESYTDYIKVDMNLTVDRPYVNAYSDPTSKKYKLFSDKFCSDVGVAYKNNTNTQSSYYGCRVIDLRAGHIIVVFSIYFTFTPNFQAVIVTYIKLNENKLGQLGIVNGSVNVQAVILLKLQTSPPVHGTIVQTTTLAKTTTTVTTTKTTSLETTTDLPSTRQLTHDHFTTESNLTNSTRQTTYDHFTTESNPNNGLICENQKTFQLFEGPVNISCSIYSPQIYNIIHVYHEGGHTDPNSVFDIKYYQDGTVYEDNKQHSDISTESSDAMITITFTNVSCLFEGTFHVVLQDYSREVVRSVSIVNIKDIYEKPSITLSPDQVTDLVFPDGNFYRTTGLHTCEGNTGFSLSNWKIDITYENGTSFVDLSTDQLKIVSRSNVTSSCINYQTVKFAIQFSEIMHKARIRCQNPDDLTSVSLSDELLLVPRNICDCGIDKSTKGHPSNCNSRVICIRDSTGIYPEGVSCDPPSWCRDSISGVCSANCSDSVCNEPVPDNFCTTPAPPTTTPVPSPYVSCNDVTAQLDSGIVETQCSLNESSSFSSISIAFRRLGESADTPVATIDSDNTNTITLHKDDLNVSFSDDVITISTNTSCENEGAFWITMLVNGSPVPPGYSKFSLKKDPEQPVLTLNPDQVIDLGFYRQNRYHHCEAVVGYPMRKLLVEILYANNSEYVELPSSLLSIVGTENNPSKCTYRQKITFGMMFSADMTNATIRCRISGLNDNGTVSNEEQLYLIPRWLCKCALSGEQRGHPNKCDRKVYCLVIGNVSYPLGLSCNTGQCRDSSTGECSDICSFDVCNEEVPEDFCTTTPTMQETTTTVPVTGISCNDVTALLNTGPVELICQLNFTTFDSVTLLRTNQTIKVEIAKISNGTIISTEIDPNRVIRFQHDVLTIKVLKADCEASGSYYIKVEDAGVTYPSQVELIVYGAAEKPIVNNPYTLIENNPGTITCSAVVGRPDWVVRLWTRQVGNDNFVIPNTGIYPGEVTNNKDSCLYEMKVEFRITFAPEWNMTDIRCTVSDESTAFNESDSALTTYDKIILIADDYCEPSETGVYKYHPRGCSYFVECKSENEVPRLCSPTLCFNSTSTSAATVCYYCQLVPPPCNSTLS